MLDNLEVSRICIQLDKVVSKIYVSYFSTNLRYRILSFNPVVLKEKASLTKVR